MSRVPACQHRSERPIRYEECKSCKGNTKIAVFKCSALGDCSIRVDVGAAQVCTDNCEHFKLLVEDQIDLSLDYRGIAKTKPKPVTTVDDVTIIVTTFDRPEKCRRFVHSASQCFPGAKIIVGDNGLKQPDLSDYGCEYIKQPHDCGLSASRNDLVRRVQTQYTLLCEDDYLFYGASDIQAMIDVLEADKTVGIVGGSLLEGGQRCDYATVLEPFRQVMHIRTSRNPMRVIGGHPIVECDQVWNFFLARTSVLRQNLWDEELKLAEHWDFFYRLKQKQEWKVVHTADCIAVHDRAKRTFDYHSNRSRAEQYMGLALRRHGLKSVQAHLQGYKGSAMPNIIVFGIGSSGTSIVTKMISKLGWNLPPDAQNEWNEPAAIRMLNERIRKGQQTKKKRGKMLIGMLKPPWVIKDPRFAETWEWWQDAFEPYEPMMVYVTRDYEAVRKSWERRWGTKDDSIIKRRLEAAELGFDRWPYQKLRFRMEDLENAISLFSGERFHQFDPSVHPDGVDQVCT